MFLQFSVLFVVYDLVSLDGHTHQMMGALLISHCHLPSISSLGNSSRYQLLYALGVISRESTSETSP